eukprot:g21968.t1
MSTSDQFEQISGAKVNQCKSEAMFFGNWAKRSFYPFTFRTEGYDWPRCCGMLQVVGPFRITYPSRRNLQMRNIFCHKSIRKWSTHSVLETLQEKDR